MRVVSVRVAPRSLAALFSAVTKLEGTPLESDVASVPRVDFRRFGRWEEIRSELLSLKGDLRIREIAEAMNVLKQRPRGVGVSFLSELRDLVMEALDQLQPRQASDILHSCVKLSLLDAPLFTAIAQKFVDGSCNMHQLDNRGLASLLYSLSQFKRLSAEEIPETVMTALLAQASVQIQSPDRPRELDSRALVMLLYSLGLLGYKTDPALVSCLTEMCLQSEVLAGFNEQEFSMLIAALDHLEVTCSTAQWHQLELELMKERRRVTLSNQGLVNVLRRLAAMKFPHRHALELLIRESTEPKRMARYNGQDLANLIHTIAAEDLSPERYLECFESRLTHPFVLERLKEEEISTVIYSFALDRKREKHSLFQALGREAVKQLRLSKYTQQGLSMLVYSFGCVKFFNAQTLGHLQRECMKEERLVSFANQSLSNMIYGLGCLRIHEGPVRHFAEALLQEALKSERLGCFNEQALANLIYSLAQLNLPQYLDPLLEEACKPERLVMINDQGLSNILQSLSWLDSGHFTKIKILLTEAARRSREGLLSEMATSNILTSLMKLGFKDRSLLAPFFKTVARREQLKKQSTESLIAVLERYDRFGLRDYPLVNPVHQELSSRDRVQKMSDQQLVQILKLVWRSGLSASKAVPYLVQELMSEKRSLEPVSVAEALTALAWLNYPDQQLFAQFCHRLTTDSALAALELPQLMQLLQATKPSTVPTESIEIFVAYLSEEQNLKQLDMSQLADLVQFHVTFGLRDESRVDRCLKEMTQKSRLSQLTLKDGSTALESVILMGMQHLESLEALVTLLEHPSLLEHCRVHYVAKLVVSLCRLGPSHKGHIQDLTEKLTQPPWGDEIAEKDLTEVLKIVKEMGYEYGRLGRLLNRRRRQTHLSPFLTESLE